MTSATIASAPTSRDESPSPSSPRLVEVTAHPPPNATELGTTQVPWSSQIDPAAHCSIEWHVLKHSDPSQA
jgi:hypothetical protein